MHTVNRREFNTMVVGVSAAVLTADRSGRAAQSRSLGAAWIGTGNRGAHDVRDFLSGCENVTLRAMADVLPDSITAARSRLANRKFFGRDWDRAKGKVQVTDDSCYTGFDAYRKVMERDDVDIVILTTPPGFRPQQLAAAVDAGKNVFMEKPAAVDSPGIRTVLEAGRTAQQKGLSIVAGTQQRRMPHYIELIKRVKDGAIGDIVAAQAYWHWGNQNWHFHRRQNNWSDVEWQIRCWPYFTWLSGDHVVEQHVHNLDVINWAMEDHPDRCIARGGRQARTGKEYGNIYDHFSGDLTYPNGVHLSSFSSQIKGATGLVGERLVGTRGETWSDRGRCYISGPKEWKSGQSHDGGKKQFQDLCAAIREEQPIVEAEHIAHSTLCGIMIRMGAYTGRALQWKWALEGSKQDLSPQKPLDIKGSLPVRPVALPGKTQLS